jgi:ABC-2 type transport system ATP-binding protein
VEAVCSQVLILNEGRIAAQGTPEEIAGTMKGGDTWELLLKGAGAEAVKHKLAGLGGELSVTAAADQAGGITAVNFVIPGGTEEGDGERIFDWAVAEGLKILGMNRKKLSLEDIFVQLTNEERVSKPLTSESLTGEGASS